MKFFGMSMQHMDSDAVLSHQIIRNWDYQSSLGIKAIVKNINPSNGVFDWSSFDKFFGSNPTKDVIFCLGQPADWMITRSAIGSPSNGGKSGMCPTGATEIANYIPAITAIVQRARDTWGRTGIKWELWNEINETKYYVDAVAALGPYTKAVSDAIKAVDPTAVILSPSLSYDLNSSAAWYTNYLTASDGNGGKAGSYCAGLSLHYYGADTGGDCLAYLTAAQTSMATAGLSLPIWITESGCNVEPPNFGQLMKRRMLIFAGTGCQAFVGYASDYPVTPLDNPKYSVGWNQMVALLTGATISNVVKNPDGTVSALVNDSIFIV